MFTTDSRTEKFLDTFGVKWEYSNDITFAMLSQSWDAENLGRSQVKVPGAIEEYGKLMVMGSAAPAPLLWRNSKLTSYHVLDGLQRLLAEEPLKPITFSAYIVLTDSAAMAEKIRVFANYRLQGGYQESSEWTLARAITRLVNKGRMSIEEVAGLGGWTQAVVRDKKQVIDYGDYVRGTGGPEKMPDSILRVISQHAALDDFGQSPVAIAGFCNDLSRTRLSAAEAEPYIEEFFAVARSKGKLFSQFQEKLEDFRGGEDIAHRLVDPSRKRYQARTAEGRVLQSLRAALTASTRVLDDQEPIYEMEEYFQVVNQIRSTLQKIERISKKR